MLKKSIPLNVFMDALPEEELGCVVYALDVFAKHGVTIELTKASSPLARVKDEVT